MTCGSFRLSYFCPVSDTALSKFLTQYDSGVNTPCVLSTLFYVRVCSCVWNYGHIYVRTQFCCIFPTAVRQKGNAWSFLVGFSSTHIAKIVPDYSALNELCMYRHLCNILPRECQGQFRWPLTASFWITNSAFTNNRALNFLKYIEWGHQNVPVI